MEVFPVMGTYVYQHRPVKQLLLQQHSFNGPCPGCSVADKHRKRMHTCIHAVYKHMWALLQNLQHSRVIPATDLMLHPTSVVARNPLMGNGVWCIVVASVEHGTSSALPPPPLPGTVGDVAAISLPSTGWVCLMALLCLV